MTDHEFLTRLGYTCVLPGYYTHETLPAALYSLSSDAWRVYGLGIYPTAAEALAEWARAEFDRATRRSDDAWKKHVDVLAAFEAAEREKVRIKTLLDDCRAATQSPDECTHCGAPGAGSPVQLCARCLGVEG